jgi:hypothetical protein
MSRILAIKGAGGEREVDYSLLSVKEIQKRIKSYEKKFGSFGKFFRSYDCESSAPEDYLTLIDWECLLNEVKNRKGPDLKLVKSGKRTPR